MGAVMSCVWSQLWVLLHALLKAQVSLQESLRRNNGRCVLGFPGLFCAPLPSADFNLHPFKGVQPESRSFSKVHKPLQQMAGSKRGCGNAGHMAQSISDKLQAAHTWGSVFSEPEGYRSLLQPPPTLE